MPKVTIEAAPAPSTQWTYKGVRYTPNEEYEVSDDLAKELSERGIGKPSKETAKSSTQRGNSQNPPSGETKVDVPDNFVLDTDKKFYVDPSLTGDAQKATAIPVEKANVAQ